MGPFTWGMPLFHLFVAPALLFATGGLWWLTHVSVYPSYATEVLPGMLLGGAGVGLVIPTLASAVAGSLPPARFATGPTWP